MYVLISCFLRCGSCTRSWCDGVLVISGVLVFISMLYNLNVLECGGPLHTILPLNFFQCGC